MRKVFLVTSVLISAAVYSQTVRQPLSSIYPGIGAYSKNFTDPFSMIVNPASLSNLQSGGAGVYGERRYLLNAFNQYTATGAFTTSSGNFGVQADYFGYNNYNESQLGFGYGRSLGSKVDIGVKFNYYNLRIPAYGNASTFYFEAGAIMHLSEKLHAGFSVYNPAGGVINKTSDEKIAAVYRGGFGYEASDHFFITAEIIKEENKNVGVNAAFQYALVKQLLVRGGINTLNSQPFLGAGLNLGQLRIDFASNWHPQLGVSPAVMLLYQFKKKESTTE
ncbi:MAG: hypothetical protein K2X48_14615 [Chitinophagaceae bacterium]|nr:hypothetical protein [Chitinophagaceae bacterium]